jgi:hypothetical protein
MENVFYCAVFLGLFTDPLAIKGRPPVARVGSRGNVSTESLPSHEYIRHNIMKYRKETVCEAWTGLMWL